MSSPCGYRLSILGWRNPDYSTPFLLSQSPVFGWWFPKIGVTQIIHFGIESY
jgi:hypothetical protein